MNLTKEELENIIPKDGPPIDEVSKYIEKYKNDLICLKYSGNVVLDRKIFYNFIYNLNILNKLGLSNVVINGSGAWDQKEIEKLNKQSAFIRLYKVTS